MAAVKYNHFQFLLRNFSFCNLRWKEELASRFYCSYAPYFKEPVMDPKQIDKIVTETEKEELLAWKVKAALNSETTSPRFNRDIDTFINYVMKKGRKSLARCLVEDSFTLIKHIQLRKYNSETDPEKRNGILLNPRDIFFLAIKNTTPLFSVQKIRKSGAWYKVPVGITDRAAKITAMKWIIESAKEKDGQVPFVHTLAHEILAAAQYEGKAIAKKIELHKLCESNRSYLHFWWA